MDQDKPRPLRIKLESKYLHLLTAVSDASLYEIYLALYILYMWSIYSKYSPQVVEKVRDVVDSPVA